MVSAHRAESREGLVVAVAAFAVVLMSIALPAYAGAPAGSQGAGAGLRPGVAPTSSVELTVRDDRRTIEHLTLQDQSAGGSGWRGSDLSSASTHRTLALKRIVRLPLCALSGISPVSDRDADDSSDDSTDDDDDDAPSDRDTADRVIDDDDDDAPGVTPEATPLSMTPPQLTSCLDLQPIQSLSLSVCAATSLRC